MNSIIRKDVLDSWQKSLSEKTESINKSTSNYKKFPTNEESADRKNNQEITG